VVARLDPRWGEVPCAFVQLKPGATAVEDDIREFCREHLARFKVPKSVVFCSIPRTSTGKLQKFLLRDLANKTAKPEQAAPRDDLTQTRDSK